MKKILVLLALLCVLPSGVLVAQTDADEEAREKLVMTFFALFEKGETQKLAALFHFPPSDSQAQVDKDTKYLAGAIDAFHREFGDITARKPVAFQKPSQDFRLHAGTIEYWQSHLDFERQAYNVTFSKAGDGYILFDMCNISSKWQIGFLRFALPHDNLKAGDILSEIGKVMWELKQNE